MNERMNEGMDRSERMQAVYLPVHESTSRECLTDRFCPSQSHKSRMSPVCLCVCLIDTCQIHEPRAAQSMELSSTVLTDLEEENESMDFCPSEPQPFIHKWVFFYSLLDYWRENIDVCL